MKQHDYASQAEKAFDVIRRDIIRCVLEPLTPVTEEQLASMYGVGRSAVRVAVKRLYQERYIRGGPRARYTIAPVTIKFAYETFAMRLLLEPEATRMAMPYVSESHLEQMEALSALDYSPDDSASLERFVSANTDFHTMIVSLTGNRLLTETMTEFFRSCERLNFAAHLFGGTARMKLYSPPAHTEIIEKLRDRDPDGVFQAAKDHVQSTREVLIEALMRSSVVEHSSITQ